MLHLKYLYHQPIKHKKPYQLLHLLYNKSKMFDIISFYGSQKKVISVLFLYLFLIIFAFIVITSVFDKNTSFVQNSINFAKFLGFNLKETAIDAITSNSFKNLSSKIALFKELVDYYKIKITIYDINWLYLWGDDVRPIANGYPKVFDLKDINIFDGFPGMTAKEIVFPLKYDNKILGILAVGIEEFGYVKFLYSFIIRSFFVLVIIFGIFYVLFIFYINRPLNELLEIVERVHNGTSLEQMHTQFSTNLDEYNKIFELISNLQASLLAKEIDYKTRTRLLDEKIQQLWEIYGLTKEIGFNLELDSILNRFIEKAKLLSYSSHAQIVLINSNSFQDKSDFGAKIDNYVNNFSLNVPHESLKNEISSLISSSLEYQEIIEKKIENYVFLSVPLISNRIIQGVLILCKQGTTNYSESVKWFLETISPLAASLIENATLYQNLLQMKNYIRNVIDCLESGIVTINLNFEIIAYNLSFCNFLKIDTSQKLDKKNLLEILKCCFNFDFATKLIDIIVNGYNFYKKHLINSSLTPNISNSKKVSSSNYNKLDCGSYLFSSMNNLSLEYGFNVGKVTYSFNQANKKVYKIFLVKALPLISENTLEGLIVIIDDITNLEDYERKIQQAEKLALIGRLAASVAHEIRNPLVAIRGIAEYLSEEVFAKEQNYDQESKDHIGVIIKEVDRINRVVQQLLSLTRETKLNLSLAKIKEIINDVLILVRVQANKKNTQISVWNENEELQLLVDVEKIKQVLINVLLNSIQAIDKPAGDIRIKITETNILESSIKGDENQNTLSNNSFVCIEITDNGRGIDEENMNKIFEPFYTSNLSGTGLGLTISKNIVELHQGKIIIESLPHVGTTVKIFLPKISRLNVS